MERYYSSQSPQLLSLCTCLWAGVNQHQRTILLPDNTDQEQIKLALTAFQYDYPEAFFVDFSYMQLCTLGKKRWVELQYLYSREESLSLWNHIDRRIAAICRPIQYKSRLYQADCIRRFIHEFVTYDSYMDQSVFTIIGALINGRACCSGISRAALLIFQYLGIPAFYAPGKSKSGELHAWNCAFLDNRWLCFDFTYDLNTPIDMPKWFALEPRALENDRIPYSLFDILQEHTTTNI